ncbi:AaceriAEL204Cp [[Ashbya] aceris (nom. inval.)]|nr:AaceriAEL204Cp [[Ashbya] aceris (nom. inval.)]
MASGDLFTTTARQLTQDLHALASESKRRNSEVKHASDRSLQILRMVHSFEELERHPDFVLPFVLSCKSGNAKFTSLSMQSLQRLAIHQSIPREQIEQVLEALIDSTQLAVEIQLKVLQIIPIFFKTYGKYIIGPLCAKMLRCCTTLLLTPSKAQVVVGTAGATLKQLINDVFGRLKYPDTDAELYDVLISNNETIKVNSYRYDANLLFTDLCSIYGSRGQQNTLLDSNCINEEYGLELLELVLLNYESLFLTHQDLLFLLRTKAVPLLLRYISSSKNFAIVVRSARCITLLIKVQYLTLLELELEVILSLLIHTLSPKSDTLLWRKALILEVFLNVLQDNAILLEVFKAYDLHDSRKDVILVLLETMTENLESSTLSELLNVSEYLPSGDQPLLSHETAVSKNKLMDLLDKTSAPSTDGTYIIFLLIAISNGISNSIGSKAVSASHDGDEKTLEELSDMYTKIFDNIFKIQKKILYAGALDNQLFHSVLRAFQKLTHAAGILSLSSELSQCLRVFCLATIETTTEEEVPLESVQSPNATGMLNAISDTLRGVPTTPPSPKEEARLTNRLLHQRNLSVFRALLSLSISLGPTLTEEHWGYVLEAWQWTVYSISGPSQELHNTPHSTSSSAPPKLIKNDTSAVEASIYKLFESTRTYSNESFETLLLCLIEGAAHLPQYNASHIATDTRKADVQGSTIDCHHNKIFYIDRISDIVKFNISRFTDVEGKDMWNKLADFLISQATTHSSTDEDLRLYVTQVFMEIITRVATDAEGSQQQQDSKFDIIGDRLLEALMKLNNAVLGFVNSSDHMSISINVDFDILFHILRTLKDLVDNFGESLQDSWTTVLKILMPQFGIIKRSYENGKVRGMEGSNLTEGIQQKHRDLVHISFKVFKLISDNFLETLPYPVIKDVIDTLFEFVQQDTDLNISFSSISQFWILGDYMRTMVTPLPDKGVTADDGKQEPSSGIQKFKSAEGREISDALWIYLLKTLVKCTNDSRLEIKKGAIQTFFRIVDSYSSSFPSWELVSEEVVEPLLSYSPTPLEYVEYADFFSITLQGLVHLYPIYFADFRNRSWDKEWSWLFSFIQRLQSSQSFEARFIASHNLGELMSLLNDINDVPEGIVKSCYEIWSSYNVLYTELLPSSDRKNNISCLEELIRSFTPLYRLLDKFGLVTLRTVEDCLAIFNTAFRYPLLPEHVSDKKKLSTLQSETLKALKQFQINQTHDIELVVWYQLSSVMVLPFDTRKRIEQKLAGKLDGVSRNRIPTFEAVSYQASMMLLERIHGCDSFDDQFMNQKYLTRTLKNLFEPIKHKSMIKLESGDNLPLWVVSSRCFNDIFASLFPHLKKYEDTEQIGWCSDLLEIYIKVLVAPLQRIDHDVDIVTEKHDISEYKKHRDLLLKYIDLSAIDVKHLQPYVSSLWNNSFYYGFDAIEDHIINGSTNLQEITNKLVAFDFSNVIGSTEEPALLSKCNLTTIGLQDLIQFCNNMEPGSKTLRSIAVPFLISRVAFVLRRYITDESLLNRAPLSKVKRLELVKVLNGLHDILDLRIEHGDEEEENLRVLYPLLLNTIPLSHKVDGLQDLLQKLSLRFNVLYT